MALNVVYFRIRHRLGRPHYVWDEYLYSIREKVEVGWDDDERKGEGETRCRLIARPSRKAPRGAARLNVPIQRTNRYQQYYMPCQHTYSGRVWNIIQDCDVQSSD